MIRGKYYNMCFNNNMKSLDKYSQEPLSQKIQIYTDISVMVQLRTT
jgi:hypothetical protein